MRKATEEQVKSLGAKFVYADIADAARLRADGCVAFKLKVGARNLREDIERTRAVCAVLASALWWNRGDSSFNNLQERLLNALT